MTHRPAHGTGEPVGGALRRFVAVIVAVLVAAGGCGLPEDPRPRAITPEMVPFDLSPPTNTETESGRRTVYLYMVDADGSLTVVERQVRDDSLQGVLQALLAGPTEQESVTSNIPEGTTLLSATVDDGLATIDLSGGESGINSITGPALLTAYAQLVLTAVALEGVNRVRFLVDGQETDVPTDGAPTRDPVDQFDYNGLDPPPLPTTSVPQPPDSNFGLFD